MVFKPDPSRLFHVIVVTCIVLIIMLLFSGCELFQPMQDGSEVQEKTGYDSEESEGTINGEEEEQEKDIEEVTDEEEIPEEDPKVEAEIEEKQVLEDENQEKFLTINVYYVDDQAQFIVGESREISGRNEEELAVDAFLELIKEPERQDLYNLIPEGTQIINAEYIDEYIFINLTSEFVENKVDDGLVDYLLVNCISATMTEIPGINGVLFKVDWEKIDIYGTLDVKNPVSRNQELIKDQ